MSENFNDAPTFSSRQGKTSDAKLTLIIFLLLILVSIGLYVIFRQGTAKDSDNTEDTQQEENTIEDTEDEEPIVEEEDEEEDLLEEDPIVEEEEEEVEDTPQPTSTTIEVIEGENVIPAGWKPIPNETYNYTAYRPGSFYYRFFGGASVLGVDPAQIPEASSYAGLITISKVEGNLQTAINSRTSTYTGKTETIVNEENGNWKIIEGVSPANEIEDSKKVISAFTVFNGVVFVVETRAAEPLYTDAKLVFGDFYRAVEFGGLDTEED